MDQIARRYAPLSRDHIPGFPNKIPKVNWSRNLPTFKDDGRKDAALHLVRFHMHIRKFKIDFPEDCLMKIFLATLEGKAQTWYESLSPACIYCLKDFHAMFIERYKDSYPSLNLVQDYCKHAYGFIESLEKFYEDDNFMDGEIMEALYENPFQQHTENLEDSHQDAQDILQQNQDQQVEDGHMDVIDEREELVSDLPTKEDNMQIEESNAINSAISDQNSDHGDQEYLVLNPIQKNLTVEISWHEENEVTNLSAPTSPELDLHEEVIQSAHEQQGEIFAQASEKVSLSEFVADNLNDNVVLDTIEECNKEIDNLVVISYDDELPYFQTIEDQIIQDYLSDSSYVSCVEMLFQEEICPSICSEFFEAHEHTFTEAHEEGKSEIEVKDTLFFQQEVAMSSLHVFQDPMADLLHPAVKVIIVVFSDEEDHGQLCFRMLSDRFVLLTRRSNQENQSRRHLLDWLHWHFDII